MGVGAVSVEAGVQAELELLQVTSVSPGLCAAVLELARQLDQAEGAGNAASAAREVRALMSDLRELAPAREIGDALDELNARRATRRGA